MNRKLCAFLFLLFPVVSYGQSVALTGSVTDTPDNQTWNNGTISFTFFGPQGGSYRWTGGTLNPNVPITATLTSTGTYSVSIPDNSQITPVDSSWIVTVCPTVLPAISGCFKTTKIITSANSVLNLTPPSPRFTVPTTAQAGLAPISAYNDTEIVGGWIGFSYYNLVSAAVRSCTTVTANTCTGWQGGVSSQIQVPCTASMTFAMGSTFATDFFVNLTCNVTSSAVSGTLVTGMEAVFTLTQDSIGNRTFVWPAGFLNTPLLATAANSTTVVTFQYCGTLGNGSSCPAGDWQNTDVGPAGVANISGGVYATQLATNNGQTLFMDTIEAGGNGCSFTSGQPTVTCTSNTFTCPSDATKIIWASASGALILNGTILTCTDSKHVTASTNAVSTSTATTLRFGHDDSAAWQAIDAAYNALINTQAVCLTVPSGMSTVKHAALVVNPTAGYSGTGPFPPCYKSLGLTYLSPTPDFNFYFYNATGTNIAFLAWGTGACCRAGGQNPAQFEGIIVDGGSLNSGTGVCNIGASPQTGMFLGQIYTRRVGAVNWCDGVPNFQVVQLDNQGEHHDITAVNSSFGNAAFIEGAGPQAPANFYGGQFACSSAGFQAVNATGSFSTHDVQFNCSRTAVTFAAGSATQVWRSDHDNFFQPGALVRPLIDVTTGTVWMTDCWAQGSASNQIIRTNGSGTVHVKGCTMNAASTQFWADSHTVPGGTIYDDGGNNIIGSVSSDAIPTGRNGIWGIGTGVATANTTLFLVPQDSTNPAFTNTTATTVSGTAAFTGTIANLVCTSTAAGAVAGSGVVTVRTAPLSTGTFAATTLTATFGQTTSAKDQTHTAAVTQGQPMQFQITTQAAETLAGVQCRVSEY